MSAPVNPLPARLNTARLKKFGAWLQARGCAPVPTTNAYELIRWEMADGSSGVLYAGKRGQSAGSAVALDAVTAYVHNRAWKTRPEPTRRASKTGKTARRKSQLAARDGACCMYCTDPVDLDELTIEHVVPLTAGGPDTLVNMGLACSPCSGGLDALAPAQKLARAVRRLTDEQRNETA